MWGVGTGVPYTYQRGAPSLTSMILSILSNMTPSGPNPTMGQPRTSQQSYQTDYLQGITPRDLLVRVDELLDIDDYKNMPGMRRMLINEPETYKQFFRTLISELPPIQQSTEAEKYQRMVFQFIIDEAEDGGKQETDIAQKRLNRQLLKQIKTVLSVAVSERVKFDEDSIRTDAHGQYDTKGRLVKWITDQQQQGVNRQNIIRSLAGISYTGGVKTVEGINLSSSNDMLRKYIEANGGSKYLGNTLGTQGIGNIAEFLFQGGRATKGYNFNIGGFDQALISAHLSGNLYDSEGNIKKDRFGKPVTDIALAHMDPTTIYNPITGLFSRTAAIGRFAAAATQATYGRTGVVGSKSGRGMTASGKSSRHGGLNSTIQFLFNERLAAYGSSPLGLTAAGLVSRGRRRLISRGGEYGIYGPTGDTFESIAAEYGRISGEMSSLFPLISDVPQTVQGSLSAFSQPLSVLRNFREQVLSLVGLSFQNQSSIEGDLQRSRNELENRVRYMQRLESASGGMAGF